jgi:hypothetical protein
MTFFFRLATVLVYMVYLVVVFEIVVDLFHDPKVGVFGKILWILGLIFVPIVTGILYILTRGRGMAERQVPASPRARVAGEPHRAGAEGATPADQIAKAKALLDAGAINNDEFLRLKGKALA